MIHIDITIVEICDSRMTFDHTRHIFQHHSLVVGRSHRLQVIIYQSVLVMNRLWQQGFGNPAQIVWLGYGKESLKMPA